MFGIFGAKGEHPLAHPKEARRVVESLAHMQPATALDEAVGWFESFCAGGLTIDQHFSLTCQIDEAVQASARRAAREYLTSPRLASAREMALWRTNHGYWSQLALAYGACLMAYQGREKGTHAIKSRLPVLVVRLLRACANQLKWEQLRYGPLSCDVWTRAGTAYLAAERAGIAQNAVQAYPGLQQHTTPEREYLKVVVFHASSMDCLMPLEVELAERLIQHFLPHVRFSAQVRDDDVYWVDCALPEAPARLARLPTASPSLRFFNTGPAVPHMADLTKALEQGLVPPEVGLGGLFLPRTALAVLRHLSMYWAPRPPMRMHVRHRVKSRISVIHGIAAVQACLAGMDAQEPEAWIVEDVSLGGMGAQLPLVNNDWLRIGSLLGLQPEGGDNWLIGVIRRFHRNSESLGCVGIQTLSRMPRAIDARIGGMARPAVMLDAPKGQDAIRIALPARTFECNLPLECELDGQALRLEPLSLVETGFDFDIGSYRWR